MQNEQRNKQRWIFSTIALGVVALTLILGTAFSTSYASAPSNERTPDLQPAEQTRSVEVDAKADSVAVTLSDGAIEVPETIAAGSVTFEVTNSGQQAHSLAISGPVEASLDSELAAGESETLTADLTPGTYTAYCSVEGHQEQESTEFIVE